MHVLEVTDTSTAQITGLRIQLTSLNLATRNFGFRKLRKSVYWAITLVNKILAHERFIVFLT